MNSFFLAFTQQNISGIISAVVVVVVYLLFAFPKHIVFISVIFFGTHTHTHTKMFLCKCKTLDPIIVIIIIIAFGVVVPANQPKMFAFLFFFFSFLPLFSRRLRRASLAFSPASKSQ